MLSREKRLRKNRDFDRVYQKGKRLSSESFNLSYLENHTQITRIGIVVGKKFSKKATDRNRAKRVFREAIRSVYPSIKQGLDIVIFVKNINNKDPKLEAIKQDLLEIIKNKRI